jgi:CBS domain containing-hemolysin-like protein
VTESGHSRLLVFGRDLDEVVGFIHAKDLLRVPADARSLPLSSVRTRRLLVVDPRRRLGDLLAAMRRARLHLALVVDDGRTAGLVSLEDVLEEVVGEIRDEHDLPRQRLRRPSAGNTAV